MQRKFSAFRRFAPFTRKSALSNDRSAVAALAVGVALLLSSFGASAGRLGALAVELDAISRPLVLTAYEDAIGGKEILAGRYDAALSKLTAARSGARSLTNLCVLHTVSRDWAQARSVCDEAVAAALRERTRAAHKLPAEQVLPGTYTAVAYANRAVMFLLSRDVAAGANDLRQARIIRPNAAYVTDNLAAMRGLDLASL